MFIKLYALTLPVLLLIDFIWLNYIAKSFYASQIGYLMKPSVALAPAAIFYLIYPIGLVVFALIPALEKESLTHAILLGGLLGLLAYGAYDLTNMATIKDWPLKMTLVDMTWGVFVSASVAGVVYTIAVKLGLK